MKATFVMEKDHEHNYKLWNTLVRQQLQIRQQCETWYIINLKYTKSVFKYHTQTRAHAHTDTFTKLVTIRINQSESFTTEWFLETVVPMEVSIPTKYSLMATIFWTADIQSCLRKWGVTSGTTGSQS